MTREVDTAKRRIPVKVLSTWLAIVLLAFAPPPRPVAQPSLAGDRFNAVRDSGFELGTPNDAWEEGSERLGTPICNIHNPQCHGFGKAGPYNGDYWVWFGGLNEPDESFVSQQFQLSDSPLLADGATVTATLYFWLKIGAANLTAKDQFTVSVDSTPVATIIANSATFNEYSSYKQVENSFPLADPADGQSHTLRFEASVDGNGITNFSIDDVMLVFEMDLPYKAYLPVVFSGVGPRR